MSRNPEKLRWAVEQIRADVDELREYMNAGPYGQAKKRTPRGGNLKAFGVRGLQSREPSTQVL